MVQVVMFNESSIGARCALRTVCNGMFIFDYNVYKKIAYILPVILTVNVYSDCCKVKSLRRFLFRSMVTTMYISRRIFGSVLMAYLRYTTVHSVLC